MKHWYFATQEEFLTLVPEIIGDSWSYSPTALAFAKEHLVKEIAEGTPDSLRYIVPDAQTIYNVDGTDEAQDQWSVAIMLMPKKLELLHAYRGKRGDFCGIIEKKTIAEYNERVPTTRLLGTVNLQNGLMQDFIDREF